MGFGNPEVPASTASHTIRLNSLDDLKAQGIDPEGMGLEGAKINHVTTLEKIQNLKYALDTKATLGEKAEILNKFLQLEQAMTSREAVMAVGTLRENIGAELQSEAGEMQDEQILLQKAEEVISGNSSTDTLSGNQSSDTLTPEDDSHELPKEGGTDKNPIIDMFNKKIEKAGRYGKIATFFGFTGKYLFEKGTEIAEGKNTTGWIGKIFFNYFLGLLGIKKGVDIFADKKSLQSNTLKSDGKLASSPNEGVGKPKDLSPEEQEKQKGNQSIYANIGSLALQQISGESFERNSEKSYILDQLKGKKWQELQIAYATYMKNEKVAPETSISSLISDLNLVPEKFQQIKAQKALVSMITSMAGPIPIALITQRITIDNIQKNIDTGKLEKKFGKKFIETIQNKTPEELTFEQISILYAVMFPGILMDKFSQGKNVIIEFAFGEDADNKVHAIREDLHTKQEMLFPKKGIQRIVGGGGSIYLDDESAFKEYMGDTVPPEKLQEFINFKNSFLKNLFDSNKYTLGGFNGFEEKIRNNLGYPNIMSIYIFLNGNPDISKLDDLASSGLFLWIINIMGEDQEYAIKLGAETIEAHSDYLTPVQSEILCKNIKRVIGKVFEIYFESLSFVSDTTRMLIQHEIEKQLGEKLSDTELTIAEWAIIISIIGAGGTVMFAPHPLARIIGFGVLATGGSYASYKLYELGVFGKMEKSMRGDTVYSLLNEVLETTYGKNISDFATAREKGISFEKLTGENPTS